MDFKISVTTDSPISSDVQRNVLLVLQKVEWQTQHVDSNIYLHNTL